MDVSKKLKPYCSLADMVADSFGRKCEVVIHDLSKPVSSVVYVANGFVTDRHIGQSFDHLIKQVLLSEDFKDDYKANYIFQSENGKKIKSSTSLIRDENGGVIGAFCLNIEIDDFEKMRSFLSDFLGGEISPEDTRGISPATLSYSISEVIDGIIGNIIGDADPARLRKSDNMKMLSFMYDKGIFLAKGSVEKVAVKLGVSPVTVYSYLDEIKKSRG